MDIIHVSNGLKWLGYSTHTFTSMYDAHGYNVPFAEAIKKVVTQSKVAVIGGINSPEMAEEIIASGKADLVVLGRQAFADPEFPNKAASGREDLIRPCVRCFHCYPGVYREHSTEPPLRGFEEVLIREVAARGITVLLETEVTPAFLDQFRPEAAILAVGSAPIVPPSPALRTQSTPSASIAIWMGSVSEWSSSAAIWPVARRP